MNKYCDISGSAIREREPLKAGDRVRLIGYAAGGAAVQNKKGYVIQPGGYVATVRLDLPVGNGQYECIVFPDQCKRIRSKAPKVNDRVKFVLGGPNYAGRVFDGIVREVLLYGNVRLTADETCPIMYPVVHFKQCRRMKNPSPSGTQK